MLVNLATGLEDAERVTVAFLLANAALDSGLGAGGELLRCPICFNTQKLNEVDLVQGARLTGATPLWEWIGSGATVFSY